jgi:hypothetical protein
VAALLAALACAPGCTRPEAHSVAGPLKTGPTLGGEPQAAESSPMPPPGEVSSAMEAGRRAESAGDLMAAAEFYEHVAMMPEASGTQVADAHFALAMMAAGPGSEQRDDDIARMHLRRMLDADPDHPRAREAALLLGVMDELGALHVRAAELTAESDNVRQIVTELLAKLDEKEKELQRVKQVLLQNKP